MWHHRMHSAASVGLLMMLACASAGCYADLGDMPPPGYAYGYAPVYYDGYVVYYDPLGRPYYHANGRVFWIAPSAPHYHYYVNHWHAYGPHYRAWYSHGGARYRGYRFRGHRR